MLLNFLIYYDFPSFYLMFLFCPRMPCRIPTAFSHYVSLGSSGCDNFIDFPCFQSSWQFWKVLQVFCGLFLHWDLPPEFNTTSHHMNNYNYYFKTPQSSFIGKNTWGRNMNLMTGRFRSFGDLAKLVAFAQN